MGGSALRARCFCWRVRARSRVYVCVVGATWELCVRPARIHLASPPPRPFGCVLPAARRPTNHRQMVLQTECGAPMRRRWATGELAAICVLDERDECVLVQVNTWTICEHFQASARCALSRPRVATLRNQCRHLWLSVRHARAVLWV